MYQYPVPPPPGNFPSTLDQFVSLLVALLLFASLTLFMLPRKRFIEIVKIMFPFWKPPEG